jgi:methylmalonyl-CoA mutase C-terminal domain/subunit
MTAKKIKVLVGKLGLDAHDNGLRLVARWLRDAGYEVVYLGLYNSPQGMVRAALEENVQLIGVSFLGGEHMVYTTRLMDLVRQEGMEDVKVIVGGVIPPDDVKRLKTMGVSAAFTPGTSRVDILEAISSLTV